jgi:glycerol kinase
MVKKYIAAIDQGTSSSRCIIFDHQGRTVSSHQIEHKQIFPKAGWVEHDPLEIWECVQKVIKAALEKGSIESADIASLGVNNQRETTVVWNKNTGQPYCNAIVWQCTRSQEICDLLGREGGLDRFRPKAGLPLSAYFSGPKIKWILDNIPAARQDALKGEAIFGTIDSWIIWWLTGGPGSGSHITDVTNASRTLLMNLHSLSWDPDILDILEIPQHMLPAIRPSCDPEFYGFTGRNGPFGASIPVCGDLGDQQAALVGQSCNAFGDTKNTYGTGCFMLMNTGRQPVASQSGLLTTLGYKIGNEPAVYCLEGSVAIAGALVQWLRDNLGLLDSSSQIETLARTVEDNGGIYFVPAFSGLFTPYWQSNARGVIVGLTRFNNKGHLARAVLEATAYQTRDVLDVMEKESGVKLKVLKVDGGMVRNELLMQFQADLLGVPVIRSDVAEITSLGAAYMAGLGVGFWDNLSELERNWKIVKTWEPLMPAEDARRLYKFWQKAVQRAFNWVE